MYKRSKSKNNKKSANFPVIKYLCLKNFFTICILKTWITHLVGLDRPIVNNIIKLPPPPPKFRGWRPQHPHPQFCAHAIALSANPRPLSTSTLVKLCTK